MQSKRIKLLPCDERVLEVAIQGDEALATYLQLNVPKEWSSFGQSILIYTLQKIQENPESVAWWTYFPVLIESNTLVGCCGFKGAPQAGKVEIGYEVAKDYRNQGLATEIAQILVDKAFEHEEVHTIFAHTLAEENASTRVLQHCGFTFVEELEDEHQALFWRWKLVRPVAS